MSSDCDLQRNQCTLSLFLDPMAMERWRLQPAGISGLVGTRDAHWKRDKGND